MPLFNISRHSDLVTDFMAIDELELFASCSMDKRIVIWSSITRRVKGVFIGHKRGIRSLSYAKNMLLSGNSSVRTICFMIIRITSIIIITIFFFGLNLSSLLSIFNI